MKKPIIIALIVVLIILSAGGFYLYKTQFSGAWIAWQPAKNFPTNTKTNDDAVIEDQNFKLPAGFSLSVLAENLESPRTIIRESENSGGNLLATITGAGKVVEIIDSNGDGKAETVNTLIEGLDAPHGIVEKCATDCVFLIAEITQLAEYKLVTTQQRHLEFQKKLVDLPASGTHYTRSLLLLPDEPDKLLIAIGSTCNVCHEEDPAHGSVQVLDLNTLEMKPFAKGLRNSVFLTSSPVSKEIWATEMGRDMLGDDLPPDEINILKAESNYGWPNCFGQNIHDDEFDHNTYIRNPCMEPLEIAAEIDIPAHSAPLGLSYIPAEGWPEEYAGDLLVAYHGSWNRSEPTGYKIVRFNFDAAGKLLGVEDFLTGFLDDQNNLYGRPAGVLAEPGGVLYVSDDSAGRIYKISYSAD